MNFGIQMYSPMVSRRPPDPVRGRKSCMMPVHAGLRGGAGRAAATVHRSRMRFIHGLEAPSRPVFCFAWQKSDNDACCQQRIRLATLRN
jgi:hypothetical protein